MPALRLMLRSRAANGREIATRLPERFGVASGTRPPGQLIWLHAASLGEAVSALPLLSALPATVHVLFTTGTVTSAGLLAVRLPELGLSARVTHQFVPLDVPPWAARFLDHWRPDAACFLESELWPNLLAACRARGIPTALVNARLSVRSAARWRLVPRFAATLLGGFAFMAAQSAADADRLRALGAAPVVWGDLKAAAAPLPADPLAVRHLAADLGDRPRWLAASTHVGDEAVAVAAHRALATRHPGLLTAIVPRHPDRGLALANALGAPRRALGEGPPPQAGIWVVDTLGELGLFYRCFPAVLMGKGFAPGGGQNVAEPARLGCAVATGPAVQNFADTVQALCSAGALQIVDGADGLTTWLDRMLTDRASCQAMGLAGQLALQDAGDLPARLAHRLVAMIGAA